MKTGLRTLSVVLVLALLLSVASPVLAQDAPERSGLRIDAPQYGVRGPHWVGYRALVTNEGTDQEMEMDLWYPALNPDGAEEKVEYEFTLNTPDWRGDGPTATHGQALMDAPLDGSAGPYPLLVFSHGFSCNPEWYPNILEHVASHGFIVLAPEHVEEFDWDWTDLTPATIDRPLDIKRTLDFAEELAASDEALAGQIDLENIAVAGHSYGGYTSLAMGGAQIDFNAYLDRCRAVAESDPEMYESMCAALIDKAEALAERAGIDGVPEGLWPAMGDSRVKAIVPMAGDSYQFGTAGLEQITVPMMVIGASGDTMTPYEWGSKPAYDFASSDKKALVTFEGGEHTFMMGRTADMPWLVNTPFYGYANVDPVWDRERSLDLTNYFLTAFLLAELKGDAEAAAALAPEAVSFPGIRYQAQGYGETAAALNPDVIAEIEAVVQNVLDERGIPGASVGVVKDGELVYAKGFGVAELGGDAAVTPQSLFHLASIGKTAVATALMQLVEQGKVNLDDPVVDYLPYFELADDRYSQITIRQMLSHTSGMGDVADYEWDKPVFDDEAAERYVRSLTDETLIAAPGEGFNYSSMAYDILGDVIAKASGQPFEEYVQEHIFTPLGMKNTTFLHEEADADLLTAPHMLDDEGNVVVSEVFPYNRMHAPSSTLTSNVEDMARYALAHLNRGELDGVRILDESSYDELWTEQAVTGWEEFFGPMYANYGIGWKIGRVGDHTAYHHLGADDGFTAHFVLVPDEDMAVIVMLNYFDPDEGAFHSMAVSEPSIEILLGAEQMQVEQPALEPDLVAEIEAFMEQEMAARQIPGAAIGIVKDGELVYAEGFGVADVESGEPVTPETIFLMSSIAKSFTGLAILQLVEQGLVELDAPVTDYLPYFTLADPASQEITIRQLLAHTSGLSGFIDWAYDLNVRGVQTDPGALEEYIRSMGDVPLEFPPGEGWAYSSAAFDVLGDVVAQVSGQTFEEYVDEHILGPIGMASSTFLLDEIDPATLASPHIFGADGAPVVNEFITYTRIHAPSDGLFSNVNDMARFAIANMNHGEIDGVRVQPASTYDEMWTAQAESPWGEGFGKRFAHYGLGWWVGEDAGTVAIGNYGADTGYCSHLEMLPEEGVAVLSFVNLQDPAEGRYHASELGMEVAHRLVEPTAIAPEVIAEIESMVEQVMAEGQIPGVSIGIAKDGEIAYEKGFGVAELGTDRPMTPQTQFAAACVTKGFTAAAIMKLVDQGLIDLNAPVTDYLPYFRLADDGYEDITIHHLLINTAGLPMPNYIEFYGGFSENPTWSPDLLENYVRGLADKPMQADPADNIFMYGGDYFDILGDVIAKVTGQGYEEYMTENFLEPLGLEGTTFIVDELENASAAHWPDETGEMQSSTPSPTYYPAHTPSNGMFSTTEDLLKWAIFNMNQGEFEGEQIVPASAWDAMWQPYTEIPWGEEYGDYGYGWGISEMDNERVMSWGGGHIGAPNSFYLVPEENLALHIVFNSSPEAAKGNGQVDAFTQQVLHVLLGSGMEQRHAEQPALEPELIAEIEAFVEQEMAARQIPGAALGIVKGDELVYAKGFGVKELGGDDPVTPDTNFLIRSVSKSFTGVGIMQLVEQGLIDLDAPVTDYLPYFTLAEPESKEITVRQLLAHTSGMPDVADFDAEQLESELPRGDDALEQYIKSWSDASLVFPPGTDWKYSTLGIDVLGDIIAKASGQSFEEYMDENVLGPLGMTSSTFNLDEVDVEKLVTPHWLDGEQAVPMDYIVWSQVHAPGSGLITTVEDMARFAIANMNHGTIDNMECIPAHAYEEMWQPQTPPTAWIDWLGTRFNHYGLGWWVGEDGGYQAIGNYGASNGTNAHLEILPELDMAVIFLGNFMDFGQLIFNVNEIGSAVAVKLADAETGTTRTTAIDAGTLAQIDAYVEEMMAGNGLPGFSLGIVQDGQLAYAHGYGLANVDSGEPVTPQTLFQVAEVTYAPTALAVLKLAHEGKIDLDAPVTDYLPYFTMQGEGADRITARHLLMHTSGVPDSGDTAADWPMMEIETDDEAIERFVRGLAGRELLFAPGEGYEWSDIGYDILGDVVAKVTGEPFEQYMQENILGPLGMATSTFLRDEAEAALLASPHIDEMGAVKVAEVVPYSRQFAAANNLHASAEDMAQFMIAVMNLGEVDGAQAVPAEAFEQMWAEPIESNLGGYFMGNLYPTDMFPVTGMGWLLTAIDGHPVIHAYGGERGFQSDMMLCPKEGIGVIAMGNGQAGGDFFAPTTAVDVMGMLLAQ